MPLSDTEVSRLADSIHAGRPDWNPRSLRAFIAAKMRGYAFADAFVALAVVAADPTSETPARVLEPGPWWTATRANRTDTTYRPGPDGNPCTVPGHEHERSDRCRLCRAEDLAGTETTAPARTVPAPADWRTR